MTSDPLPTADDFWDSIEDAWSGVADDGARVQLLSATTDEDRMSAADKVSQLIPLMLDELRQTLQVYSAESLSAWDAICERALYDIDREDVHSILDGSDDGFLYARGFVVAAGRRYYEAVNTEPAKYGVMDFEAESMCYFGAHVYNSRFGEWVPRSDISRETCSNAAGWPSHRT